MPPTKEPIFHVAEEQAKKTIAAALRVWLADQSWSQIRQLLRSRRVMVDGNICVDEGRRLNLNEVVKIIAQSAPRPPDARDVKLQYLDAYVCVVEKPAGVTSNRHADERDWPAKRKQLQPTLDELLAHVVAKMDPRARQLRGVPPPVRAVHRLDRETSGLMVFARTPTAERHLADQFRKHTTERCYLAVAPGKLSAQRIQSRLIRDRGDGRRGSTKESHLGKHAVTHIKPLKHLKHPSGEVYTLLECRLETGRTHQIRIHLAELGHPLCGERVYHQPLFGKALHDPSGAPRVALHARSLAFDHPISGERMGFEMPLPQDLQEFLATFRPL
ncbi:MAG: RluA family pseudouridine synthase [Planctomycetota bacterium]|nr:RluA family pseudouridine synthase [Planctomycetota bacterium]